MTHLLDVNILLAAIWDNHPLHERAFAGLGLGLDLNFLQSA
jgi:predicted nucleic acid-binding protein